MSESMYLYTFDELEELPTLSEGYVDNMKIDEGDVRWWLSRCGIFDGEPYENTVTVEALTADGQWRDAFRYDGDDVSQIVDYNQEDVFISIDVTGFLEDVISAGYEWK